MKPNRTLASILLPAALVAAFSMTACTGGNDFANQTGKTCAASGAASESVKLSGRFGEEVQITSKTPITSTSLERTVAIRGTGEKLAADTPAVAKITVFNGKSGAPIAPGAESTVVNDPEQTAEWVAKAVDCSAIGDRIVIVTPVSTVLPPGQGATYQLADSDSLVMVFDFLRKMPVRAEGKTVQAPEGFPEVVREKNGRPVITMPSAKAPDKLKVATLIRGEGETVEDGDQVTVHYVGAIWRNGEIFNSTWEDGQPATFNLVYPNGVIEGFHTALVGAKVGSQVIAVVPPASGYGKNTATTLKNSAKDVKNSDVLVFVIDILAAVRSS